MMFLKNGKFYLSDKKRYDVLKHRLQKVERYTPKDYKKTYQQFKLTGIIQNQMMNILFFT